MQEMSVMVSVGKTIVIKLLRKLYFVLPGKAASDALHLLSNNPEFQCENCQHYFEFKQSDQSKNFKQCMANLWTEELARSYHKHFKCKYFSEKIKWPRK